MAEDTSYKESRADWLGVIPQEWSTCLLKYIFSIEKRIAGTVGHTVLSVTQSGIKPKDMSAQGQFAQDYSKYQLVYPGDFAMNHMDLLTGWVDISAYEGVTSRDYRVCVNTDESRYVSEYYKYIFQYCYTNRVFYGMGQGVSGFGRWRLPANMFLNFRLPVPPYKEQIVISEYLKKKTAQIDALISEAKASIDEYKQWKASIIHEAITKGIDPDVGMVDSGIRWIGMIPNHWKITRIKNETINLDSLREPISAENRENRLGLYDYYGASGVIDKIDDYNVDDTVLLIGEDGANLKMRNLPLVYRASGRFWVNNHAHILKVNDENNYGYVAYLLEAGDYTEYITGAAQPKLSQFNLMRFPIPIAPRVEQDAIEAYLDNKIGEIDALIKEKEALISDLDMYKRALIFELVTGKRRVV